MDQKIKKTHNHCKKRKTSTSISNLNFDMAKAAKAPSVPRPSPPLLAFRDFSMAPTEAASKEKSRKL
jgi:hypothetical protein